MSTGQSQSLLTSTHIAKLRSAYGDRSSDTGFTVFIVDDDSDVLGELSHLVAEAGYRTRSFSSARGFLADHDPVVPGCAVINVAMSELDGLQLQQTLSVRHVYRPIIFMADKDDIRTSVRAMKSGAIDCLTKPIDGDALLGAIDQAREAERKTRHARSEIALINSKISTLTPREREVLAYVIAGRRNKQIAGELGTAVKTIKVHRARVMTKLEARTLPDLVRLAERAGVGSSKLPGTPYLYGSALS
jgi:FixJ family two-component response regulator